MSKRKSYVLVIINNCDIGPHVSGLIDSMANISLNLLVVIVVYFNPILEGKIKILP